jgi:hypothetical protein
MKMFLIFFFHEKYYLLLFTSTKLPLGVLGLRHLKYVQDFLMCFDIFLHLLEVIHTLINLDTVSLTTNMSYLSFVSYISNMPDIS